MDFLGVHTYPSWEGKTIDEALQYTIENIAGVQAALPGNPLGAEKHWGLFNVDRTPTQVVADLNRQ